MTGSLYENGVLQQPAPFVTNQVNTTYVTTTPYTVLSSDQVIYVTTAAVNFTLNLPATTAGGKKLKILVIKIDSGAGTITITPNGAETIEGAGTKVISSQYGKCGLVADSANTIWYDLGTGGV